MKEELFAKGAAIFLLPSINVQKIVETTGSLIERLLPKSIYAVTAKALN